MSNQLPANRIYKSSSPRAVLAMAGAGDLEKLPLEIRNEIYVLVFTRPKPLVLCNFGGDQPGIDRRGLDNEWARSATATKVEGHRRSVKAIGHQRVGQKWVKAPSKIALICVNEKVSAEAVAVLYSRTKFRFARAGTVRRFLNLIGDKKQYLRDVGMCVCGWKFGRGFYEARYAMEALAAAKCIRRVEVAHVDVCPQVPATSRRIYPGSQKVVKLCEPLLNSLKTAYEDKDLNASVLDVVRISAVDNYCTVVYTHMNVDMDLSTNHAGAPENRGSKPTTNFSFSSSTLLPNSTRLPLDDRTKDNGAKHGRADSLF
jgi:hypothetical protein